MIVRPASDSGFTLVEVLISLFIFSLISTGAYLALASTLDARERAEARIEAVEHLAAARRIMADDFAALTYRTNRDGLGGFIDPSREFADEDVLSLTRRGRPNPGGAFPRGDLQRVSYRVEGGQLIRSYLPHENPGQVERARDRVILDGVAAMAVAPVQPERGEGTVRVVSSVPLNQLIATGGLPAVSLTLTHADGTTTRHVFALPDA